MATFKAVTRKDRENSQGKTNIAIRVSHKRKGDKTGKVRYIATSHYIEPKWMGSDGFIKAGHPSKANIDSVLLALTKQYNDAYLAIATEAEYMDTNALVNRLKADGGSGADFAEYTWEKISALKRENRHSLAVLYEVTLKHLLTFSGQEKLLFKEITPFFIERFEKNLRMNSASTNTVRNYLCNIRAIFNHAINEDKIKPEIYPFRRMKIRQDRKEPRALDLKELKKLRDYRDKAWPGQKVAIDIFFLILYTGGTNLKDLVYLKKEDLRKGYIHYDRFKTGRNYVIKIFPEAQEILDRYQGEKYLLNLIEKKGVTKGSARKTEVHNDIRSNINKHLMIVNKKLQLGEKPTTYVARYSFATLCFQLKIPRDVIAMILGHGLNTMTDLYIDFDEARKKSDAAIGRVIKAIKS
jgi:integrase